MSGDDEAFTEELAKMRATAPPCTRRSTILVAHHVAVTSTLPVFERIFTGQSSDCRSAFSTRLSAEAQNQFLEARVRFDLPRRGFVTISEELRPVALSALAFEQEKEFERAFVKAGGAALREQIRRAWAADLPGFGDQRELELLVEAGFTPIEAIHIATFNGAQYLGELDRIGTIAAGKQADLVVIKGDPSKKIEDIENVETVFKDGVGYDSAKLIESVRGLVGVR